MKKFNSSFKVGTKVLMNLAGEKLWVSITEINEVRNNIKVEGWAGSFQRNHVIKFSNK